MWCTVSWLPPPPPRPRPAATHPVSSSQQGGGSTAHKQPGMPAPAEPLPRGTCRAAPPRARFGGACAAFFTRCLAAARQPQARALAAALASDTIRACSSQHKRTGRVTARGRAEVPRLRPPGLLACGRWMAAVPWLRRPAVQPLTHVVIGWWLEAPPCWLPRSVMHEPGLGAGFRLLVQITVQDLTAPVFSRARGLAPQLHDVALAPPPSLCLLPAVRSRLVVRPASPAAVNCPASPDGQLHFAGARTPATF